MKHGKRELPQQHRNHKGMTALVAVVLVFCCTVGVTLAWLFTQTEPVTNTFTPASVTTEVHEDDFNGGTKRNVKVKNTGNTDAYIRAAIIYNWADADGNIYAKPVAEGDYTLSTGSKWNPGDDGYYYYSGIVNPGDPTENLIDSLSKNDTPADVPSIYDLQVTILAEGIQAKGADSSGKTPVELAWGEDAAKLVGAKS